jgi:hypothetical protein
MFVIYNNGPFFPTAAATAAAIMMIRWIVKGLISVHTFDV